MAANGRHPANRNQLAVCSSGGPFATALPVRLSAYLTLCRAGFVGTAPHPSLLLMQMSNEYSPLSELGQRTITALQGNVVA
jgi:hypothetical protein